MGPGMAVKAAMPRHFSIVVFGLTQVVLDLEVLWHIVRHEYPLHTSLHTCVGSSAAAIALAVIGKPASQWIKRIWNRIVVKCHGADLAVNTHTTWTASLSAAFIGTLSHILLDSLFHPDIEPLQPWSPANRLRGVVDRHGVELLCIVLGVIGLAWFFGRELKRRKASHASHATASSNPDPDPPCLGASFRSHRAKPHRP